MKHHFKKFNMAYTYNCSDCSQRDQQFKNWMAKLKKYDKVEDVSQDISTERFPAREVCLQHEENFYKLSTKEKEEKKEQNIQSESAALNNGNGNYYFLFFS